MIALCSLKIESSSGHSYLRTVDSLVHQNGILTSSAVLSQAAQRSPANSISEVGLYIPNFKN